MESAAFGAVASLRCPMRPPRDEAADPGVETTWTRTGQKLLRCEPGQGRDAGVGRDHGQHVLEHEVERRGSRPG